MKIMFSAGEASGDIHASQVAKALKTLYPSVNMIGMGGAKMEAEGVRLVYHIDKLSYIGLVEIVKALPKFFALRSYLRKVMEEEKPDVFVCVDYPGFNMKMAKVAHDLGIPVVYYICPTIWAWHKSRGKAIAKYTTKVASIFPFEAKAYEEFNAPVEFVGHPLLDIVKASASPEEVCARYGIGEDKRYILLMPGSRLQEVKGLLHTMLEGAQKVYETHDDLHFLLPRAYTIDRALLEEIVAPWSLPITITEGDTYDVMQCAYGALAASGTATLETALMNVPTVLVYRVAPLTYALGKRLVRIPHVGLPNIVAGKEVIPELLQEEVTGENIARELTRLLDEEGYYTKMKEELAAVKTALGKPGAVLRVAQIIGRLANGEETHEHL